MTRDGLIAAPDDLVAPGRRFAAWALVVFVLGVLVATADTGALTRAGLTRQKAVMLVGGGSFLLGIPSAINLTFFANQDNVWGIGLMLSGFFFAMASSNSALVISRCLLGRQRWLGELFGSTFGAFSEAVLAS